MRGSNTKSKTSDTNYYQNKTGSKNYHGKCRHINKLTIRKLIQKNETANTDGIQLYNYVKLYKVLKKYSRINIDQNSINNRIKNN